MGSQTVELGKLLNNSGFRDAIHIAVAPVTVSDDVNPGQPVGFVREGDTGLVGPCKEPIGIIDPFLSRAISKGSRCWMLLLPNTITSLRHEWIHPAFTAVEQGDVAMSLAWLADFASEFDLSCDAVIEAAANYLRTGRYCTIRFDTPDRAYSDMPEFWRHYQIVTGQKVDEDNQVSHFFSCSC